MPKPSSDPLSALRSLAEQDTVCEDELRCGFLNLEKRMQQAMQEVPVHGKSDNCTLQCYGDDEAYYGFLSFIDNKLTVPYRTTEDDLSDAFSGRAYDPTFSVESIAECSGEWLRALSAPAILESLLTSLQGHFAERVRSSTEGTQALAATANMPFRNLETSLENVARELDYQTVLEDWKRAQAALSVDPPDAATRACRLLESLCKHILNDLGIALPAKQSIQSLFKTTARALHLSPDQQTSSDLQTMASGVFSVVHGIGSLRTHVGTAHGRAAEDHKPSVVEARLAVNSAGAAATFLMEIFFRTKEDSA